MQYGIDPVAFAVALVAIWFTWKESRRNNIPILKGIECKGSSETSIESKGKIVDKFEIWIRNCGMSLYGVRVCLAFQGKDGSGWATMPLRRSSKYDNEDYPEFARGMVGKFSLRSDQLTPGDRSFLNLLKDPAKQKAELSIYSQDYLAYSIRIGNLRETMKRKWNWFAFRFNRLFSHSHGTNREGTMIEHTPTILPEFVTLEHGLMYFVEEIRKPEKPPVPTSQPTA
jgi:hypothetical protein